MQGFVDLLPEGFDYPVYIIKGGTNSIFDDSTEFDASTVHGVSTNYIIGSDDFIYEACNIYCFNDRGQGLKIEDFRELEVLYSEKYRKLAELKYTQVGLVPWSEHSRVMPLTPDDYIKINTMLKHIDDGVYKFIN